MMTKEELQLLTDEELLEKKKEWKKSKTFWAFAIGFLVGVFLFGIIGWLMDPERRFGFLIPMLIPILFIRAALKGNRKNKDLESVLKTRNL